MQKTALIMAGGRGERFWPKSRVNLPKQFLRLTDDSRTMIQLTVERILPMVNMEDIYVVTNENYRGLVREQLPDLPEENILCEPAGRNTAPCIGLGAMHIAHKYDDALMMVLASDHLIRQTTLFRQTLNDACEIAQQGENLVTMGITPSYPETGYGYIKFNSDQMLGRAYAVERFVEKPDLDKAKTYLESGDYLWNSGMFVWKVSTILNNIRTLLPELYTGLDEIRAAIGTPEQEQVLRTVFPKLPSVSIDYGVMEKAQHIYTLAGNFGWDDVGNWLAVSRIRKSNEFGNVVSGHVVSVDTENCIIEGQQKLIATIGLRDIVVVDTDDALLICATSSTGDVKKVLENLKICNQYEYL